MFLDVSLAAYLLFPPEPDLGEDRRKFVLSALVEKYLKESFPVLYKQVLSVDYPEKSSTSGCSKMLCTCGVWVPHS